MRECVVRVGFGTCQADEPFSVLAFPAPLARSLRTPATRNLRIFTSEWAFRHHTKLVGDV
jgi:hypothetical protein